MAQIVINTGNIANDGTGDPLRTAFNDVNTNFTQVFNAGPVNSNITIANNTIQTTNTNGNLILATNGIGVVVPATNFVPDIANVRMVGSATKRFNTVYTQYLDALSSTISGNLNVQGNLQVTGNIVTVNYSTANIANLTMTLAGNAISASTANGAGILVHAANANLVYNYSANTWNSTISITAPAFIGDGSQLTNVTANTPAQNLQGNTINPNVIYSNLTTFGTVESIQASGDISTTGNVYANVITGTIVTANVLVGDGGNISNVAASAIVGNVTSAITAQNALTANLAALATQAINANTALFAINASIAATANTATSALTANAAYYSVQSDNANSAVVAGLALELAPTANLSITGNIYVGGILTDGYYYANGTPFSGGGAGSYGNANVAAYLPTYTGNISNLTFGGGADIIGPNDGNGSGYLKLMSTYDVRLGNDAGPVEIWPANPGQSPVTFSFDGNGNLTLPTDRIGATTAVTLTAGGVGYTTATDVPTYALTGSGSGMTVDIVASNSGSNPITSVAINNPGVGYANGDSIQVAQPSSTGTGQLTVTSVAVIPPSINYANGTPYGGGSGPIGPNISVTGNITAGGNISANTFYIGNTPFTRTLTVGRATTPVTVPLASNNSFNVGTASGNVVVYTT